MEESGRGGIEDLEATLHRLVELVHPRHYLAMQVEDIFGNIFPLELPFYLEKLQLSYSL